VTARPTTLDPTAVGWRSSSRPGRCARQTLVAGAPCGDWTQATKPFAPFPSILAGFLRGAIDAIPRPKDVMMIPFEERLHEPPQVPSAPACNEMSLRIARRGEGAAIDEGGPR
jgi:hypothetical protein